jgi:hypothetical protein
MRRLGRRIIGPLALVLAAGIGLTACSKDDGPEPILKAFLQGWQTHGDLSKIGFLDSTGKAIPAADVAEQIKRMSGELTDRPITFQSAKPTEVKDDASAGVTVNWQLSETVVWRYQITVRLQKRADHWAVVWTPETLHPDLQTGDKLTTSRIVAPRGDVVDSDDQPIVKDRPIVVVGSSRAGWPMSDQLIARLDAAFKSVDVNVDLSDLPKEIAAAKPDSFLEIVTLRREVYDRIRDDIQPLGGTVFREGSLPLAPTRVFARALLGRVGEVQKDYMDAHPGEYQVGDLVGQGGLQEEYEGALRGSPGIAVKISGRVTRTARRSTCRRSSRPNRKRARPCTPHSTRRSRSRPTRRSPASPAGRRWSPSGSPTAPSSRSRTARTAAARTSPSPRRRRPARPSRWSARWGCSTPVP